MDIVILAGAGILAGGILAGKLLAAARSGGCPGCSQDCGSACQWEKDCIGK